MLSRPSLSRAVGRAAEARLPGPVLRAAIAAYVRFYGVDLAEAAEPAASFRTFDQFFTRRLREGARPVDAGPGTRSSALATRGSARSAASPRTGAWSRSRAGATRSTTCWGRAGLAAKFDGGAHATLYLSPAMYHRVHWPADGRVVGWQRIPGRLYPVNALAVRHVDRLFAVNQRVVVEIESDAFGPVAVVMVGATSVGRISLTFESQGDPTSIHTDWVEPARPIDVRRGDELGTFHLGSTVVLLASDKRLMSAGPVEGTLVKMGQALWRRA